MTKRSTEKNQSTFYRKEETTSYVGRCAQFILRLLAKSLDSPLLGYFAAILISNVTLIITMLLVRIFPSFAYPGLLNILGILIIALLWGPGPSLFATLLATLLLNLVLISPQFAWSFYSPTHWVDTATFLLIGLLISIIASRVEHSREQAVLAWQRLHDLFMQAPANIAVFRGPQHRFELANPPYLRTKGRSDVLGKPAREVFPEAEQERFMQMFDQVYTTGIPFVGNEVWAQMRTSDGLLKEGYFNFVCQPTHDANGAVDGLLIHSVEVTEQVKARQHLKESLDALLSMAEALVQSLPEESPTPQDSLDQSQQAISRLAALIRQVLGCERVGILRIEAEAQTLQPTVLIGSLTQEQQEWFEQLAGCRLEDYLAPELRERLLAGKIVTNAPSLFRESAMTNAINPTLLAPLCIGPRLLGLLLLDCSEGECLSTSKKSVLVGAVSRLASLMIERERLLYERTQAQANEMAAREATRKMDTFLGIASHELKTPLTVIKGNLQLMMWQIEESMKPQQRRAYSHEEVAPFQETLVDVGQQVNRLIRLVNDLLDVSRAHANGLEMRMDVCNLSAIVEKTVEEQRAVAPSRTIRFKRNTSDLVLAYADADRLGQVITNYLTNALKYSPPDQPIEVEIEQEEHLARILVRDHGPGLDPAQQEQVWDRFRRLEGVKVMSGSAVGLGLGLYISKMIIEGHQGKVGVESLPGEGSTFWFALPTLEIEEDEDEDEPALPGVEVWPAESRS